MAKDIINENGEEKVVREDTARAFRGTNWALISVGAIILIALVLLLFGFLRSATDSKPMESPGQIEQKRN